MRRDVFFLGEGNGRRFCLATWPSGEIRGALLHVHPFAEELNRSRPMCALATAAFADAGWLVLQMDGHGCGDSFGDFADATWASWQDDLDLGRHWLAQQGHPVATLWTLRSGSLLAASWLKRSGLDWPVLMWQPMISGKQLLTQILRARLADDGGSDSKHVMGRLRQQLKDGAPVEVGGYVISSALASGMEEATLDALPDGQAPLGLMEVVNAPAAALTPAATALLARCGSGTRACASDIVHGPKFWQSMDTRMAPELAPRSVSLLESLL